MKKNEFMEQVAESIREYLPQEYQNAKITVQHVEKQDGTKTGIMVQKDSETMAPVVYLDAEYDTFMQGKKPFSSILSETAEQVVQAERMTKNIAFDPSTVMNFETCASMLRVQLMSKEQSPNFLRKLVYTYEQPDCIATYAIDLNNEMHIRVTNEMMKTWGITKEQLRDQALQNMQDPVLCTMTDMLHNILAEQEPDIELPSMPSGIYVLTNKAGQFGAAMMMKPEILEMVGGALGNDYFILPSSIHEVLCIKCEEDISMDSFKEFQQMVHDINRDVVDPCDVLSDQVSYYSCEGKQLIVPQNAEELKKMLDQGLQHEQKKPISKELLS